MPTDVDQNSTNNESSKSRDNGGGRKSGAGGGRGKKDGGSNGKSKKGKSRRGKSRGKSKKGKSRRGKSKKGRSKKGKSHRGKSKKGRSKKGKSRRGKSKGKSGRNKSKNKNGNGGSQGPSLSRRVFDASSSKQKNGRSGRKRRGGRRRGGRSKGKGKGSDAEANAEDQRVFGQTWWGKRWLAAIEDVSPATANRLPRGLTYAQNGHVKKFRVKPGRVEARVRGRRKKPYKVTLKLRKLTNSQWRKVIEMLGDRAAFAANLLAGELPEGIIDVFESCGLSLFPSRNRELKASCSCPDWANPCKHIAAVHYVLGDELDDDPFLLLALRGRTRGDVLAALRAARSGEGVAHKPIGGSGKEDRGISVGQINAKTFFEAEDDLLDFRFHIAPPEVEMPVLRRIGTPPKWTPNSSLVDILAPVYEAASERARRLGLRDLDARPQAPLVVEEDLEETGEEEDEEGRRAVSAPGAEVISVGEEGEDEDSEARGKEGSTVLVRRRDKGRSRRRRKRRKGRSGKRRRNKRKRGKSKDNNGASAVGELPKKRNKRNDANVPRLSRRVMPGTTEGKDAPTLEDRLEMIIPITEAMPDGPEIARQIIWALKTHGSATARQLARRTRMKKTAVLSLLQSLLAVGLVIQEGKGERARYFAPDS